MLLFMVKGHLDRDRHGSVDLKEVFLLHSRLVPLLVGQVVRIWPAVGGPRYPSAPSVSTAILNPCIFRVVSLSVLCCSLRLVDEAEIISTQGNLLHVTFGNVLGVSPNRHWTHGRKGDVEAK